jgi:hypothetical protein
MLSKVGPGTGCVYVARRKHLCPELGPRSEREPGRGIHLDHVGRRSASVSRPLDRLDRAERRNPYFHGVAGRLFGEKLEKITHRRRRDRAVHRAGGTTHCTARDGRANRAFSLVIRYPRPCHGPTVTIPK